jgi:hypothetical protein
MPHNTNAMAEGASKTHVLDEAVMTTQLYVRSVKPCAKDQGGNHPKWPGCGNSEAGMGSTPSGSVPFSFEFEEGGPRSLSVAKDV